MRIVFARLRGFGAEVRIIYAEVRIHLSNAQKLQIPFKPLSSGGEGSAASEERGFVSV